MKVIALAALAPAVLATVLKAAAQTPTQATQCIQDMSKLHWNVNLVLDLCRDTHVDGMGVDMGRQLSIPRMSVPDIGSVDLEAIDIQNVIQGVESEDQTPTTYSGDRVEPDHHEGGSFGGSTSSLDSTSTLGGSSGSLSSSTSSLDTVDLDGGGGLGSRSTSLLDVSSPPEPFDVHPSEIERPESSLALVDHDYVYNKKSKTHVPHAYRKTRQHVRNERRKSSGPRRSSLRLSISHSASRLRRRLSSGAKVVADGVTNYAKKALVGIGFLEKPLDPAWKSATAQAAEVWRKMEEAEKHIVTESFMNMNMLARARAFFMDVETCEFSVDLLRPRLFSDLKKPGMNPMTGNVGSVYFPASFFEYVESRPGEQVIEDNTFAQLVFAALVEDDLWLRRAEMCLPYWSNKQKNFPYAKYTLAVVGSEILRGVRVSGDGTDSYRLEADPVRNVRTPERLETLGKLWSEERFAESEWDYLVRRRIVDKQWKSLDDVTDDLILKVLEQAAFEYGLDPARKARECSALMVSVWLDRIEEGDVKLSGDVPMPVSMLNRVEPDEAEEELGHWHDDPFRIVPL